MSAEWDDCLRRQFRYAVECDGVQKVADAIPAGRDTVYRLIKGQTGVPSLAVHAGIVRFLADREDRKEA